MAKSTAFSLLNTLLVVVLLGAVAATVYNRQAITDRLRNLRSTPTPQVSLNTVGLPSNATPAPTDTPTPAPTATPALVATTRTGDATSSITQITPDGTSAPLPRSGPEETGMLVLGATGTLSGTSWYYYSLRKKLKKSWENLDVR